MEEVKFSELNGLVFKSINKIDDVELENTASFDVDAQKGFTPLCPDNLPVPGGDEIVEALNHNATFAKYRVGSKDAHPPNADFFASKVEDILKPVEGNPNVDVLWPSHCVVGTYGFELLDGLPDPLEYDFFVYKGIEKDCHPYGACYHDVEEKRSTGVIEFLKSKNVKNVIVGGLATDYCVKTTAIQLKKAGFDVCVILDACRHVNDATYALAKQEMIDAGIIVSSNNIKY